ncbi:thiamine pyrophosphate-binding protein [Noviherbaspirillum saxi]|uniref:Thiamine pyrophosphate-binding protein n=1 Tax=Noviherbaspirillum saxi TaxID=2320863 RepID=A0A3A3FTU6_9BURK|nr:thiamine pyrophosphate-binding protein [Noviherbaspirillum saxi]RJF97601.1 thiamine pyrophosphate-binding protein [Noviherbaspirillum saxi]
MRFTDSLASNDAGWPEQQPSSPLNIAGLLVAYLEQLGVEHVFGVPGGAIEPLYNALAQSSRRGGPRPVVARHEAGAAFMADGYTRETGRIGVCCATSGPGATNLITGVACAYDNGIPMLVITGQPALPGFGKRALQESSCTGINTLAMFRHCTRYNSLISHPEQLEAKLIAALMRATRTPRGPVHLSIPLDILKSPAAVAAPSYDLRTMLQPSSMLDGQAVERLAQLLDQAVNPVFLVGGWCGEAIASILSLAERRRAAFVTTPDGKGLVDPRHPLYRGVFGFAGHASAEAVLRDTSVDLILAIGSSMNEWTSSGWSDSLLNTRLVHIDESDDHLARTPMAKLHVSGRILTIFERLHEHFEARQHLSPALTEPRLAALPAVAAQAPAGPVKPQQLMHELGRLFPATTRYLADAGNSVAWAVHHLSPQIEHPDERGPDSIGGWLRTTMDFAPMGWAIGGAVGTALGNPDGPVVCITGDGSMLMNGQELSVAVAERLTVIFVVLNDAALGMVKHGQRLAGAEAIAFALPPTDFAMLARAQGAAAYTIRNAADLAALDIDAISRHPGPTLLDVQIDAEEVPPIGVRMRVLGTAM